MHEIYCQSLKYYYRPYHAGGNKNYRPGGVVYEI